MIFLYSENIDDKDYSDELKKSFLIGPLQGILIFFILLNLQKLSLSSNCEIFLKDNSNLKLLIIN